MNSGLGILGTIIQYYTKNRGVGHSTLMMKGTREYDRPYILVVANHIHQQALKSYVPKHTTVLTIDDIYAHHRLQGLQMPMMIEHYALEGILAEAQGVIVYLESYLQKQGEEITRLQLKLKKTELKRKAKGRKR